MPEDRAILRGFKTELRPTPTQVEFFRLNRDAARDAYNIALRQVNVAYRRGEKFRIGDVKKALRCLKKTKEGLLWMGRAIDRSVEYALNDLQSAFQRFFKWCKTRKGPRVGAPRLKRYGPGSFSFLGTTVKVDRVKVPKCGWVRLKEKGYLPEGRNSHRVTITERAGRWFVTVLDYSTPVLLQSGRPSVGLDVNLVNFATLSDGIVVPNPCHIDRFDRKLRLWSKRMSRRRKGSAGWEKARQKVANIHYRCACARRSFLHELSTKLVRKYGKIVVETLGVRDMMGVHRLARRIADASWYEFRRQLTYKGEWYGTEIVAVEQEFPSTQQCPTCGARCKVDWKKRTCTCPDCGGVRDMDDQAAMNLAGRVVA